MREQHASVGKGWLRPVIALAACWLVAAPSWAQVSYTCRDEAGNVYRLSRACPTGMKTTSVSAGPAASSSRNESRSERSYSPSYSASPAPEYHRYMSARCRSLYDTMRSGNGSVIKPEVMTGMRREYERDCREEEGDASLRYSKEQREARKQRQEDQRVAEQADQASRERDARTAQQCAESRRILAAKKARTDLTPGELNDLRRFEEAVGSRCAL